LNVRLLVTRAEPDAERAAAPLRALGHEVTVAPLTRIETVDADLGAGPWSAVLITSANAARAIAAHPRRQELLALPVFAVGRRSAEAARAAGFANVISADGDVDGLARLVAARMPASPAPLIYLAGEDRAGNLAGHLGRHRLEVQMAVVYRAVAAASLPEAVRQALVDGRLDGVLHFSRRSSAIYLNAASAAGLLDKALIPLHYCLSAQVAAPLLEAGAADVRTAARAEEAALVELIGPT
jgi:uroporphyrinogen-III synthase